MNKRENTGLAGIDMVIAVIAIIIFTTLILALMSNNVMENVKNAEETMAMIYITEIFENIGIADYDNVTNDNKENFIPQQVYNNYNVNLTIGNVDGKSQDILKKINLVLTYKIGNKTYSCSAERIKAKE